MATDKETCNTALGKLGDNVAGLRRALEYVTGPAEAKRQ